MAIGNTCLTLPERARSKFVACWNQKAEPELSSNIGISNATAKPAIEYGPRSRNLALGLTCWENMANSWAGQLSREVTYGTISQRDRTAAEPQPNNQKSHSKDPARTSSQQDRKGHKD